MKNKISNNDDPMVVKPLLKNEGKTSPSRGALKIEISTATPMVVAGQEFSIYVIIRNPFPVPVTIHSTETHIPVELSDQIWKRKWILNRDIKLFEKIEKSRSKSLKFYNWILYKWSKRFNHPSESPRVAVAVGVDKPLRDVSGERVITIQDANNIYIDNWQLSFGDLTSDEVNERLWKISKYLDGDRPVVLRQGDSTVKHFILKTSAWLFFKPISHTFQIQIQYEVDEMVHIDTIPFAFNIKAATMSTMIGAFFGSILGTIINTKFEITNWIDISQSLVYSIISSVILIVAFARKNDVQQIVSIEDFWGGLFIGFLAGYSGEDFFSKIINKQ